MTATLNASTSAGVILTSDTSGSLDIQSNGTTKLSVASGGVTATVATLNAPSGVLATQNGMTGIAKAWVQFGDVGGTVSINKSFNCSSVTRNAAGYFTFNFTTAMTDTGYVPVGSAAGNTTYNTGAVSVFQTPSTGAVVAPTTSAFVFAAYNTAGANFDPTYVCISVLGN